VYDAFGAYLDSLRQQAGIPGLAAAIVDLDGIAWEQAYGRQHVDRGIPTRTDTPFNAEGLTQVFTAAMVLQCVEQGRLSLDDRIGDFDVNTLEPDATIRQLLTHTSGAPESLTFLYRPQRLEPLWRILRTCTVDSYREAFANLLKRHAMTDSVPGANIVNVRAPLEGVPFPEDVERYNTILARRAAPYAVDGRGRAFGSSFPPGAEVLTASSGLITTVRDLAIFDSDLRRGLLQISPETLASAWSAPGGSDGLALPHGVGWFVQDYKGEKVVWQFGMIEDASSALMITLPSRGLTLIMMANSDRLVKQFSPAKGDISLSPFARLFLNLFVR